MTNTLTRVRREFEPFLISPFVYPPFDRTHSKGEDTLEHMKRLSRSMRRRVANEFSAHAQGVQTHPAL